MEKVIDIKDETMVGSCTAVCIGFLCLSNIAKKALGRAVGLLKNACKNLYTIFAEINHFLQPKIVTRETLYFRSAIQRRGNFHTNKMHWESAHRVSGPNQAPLLNTRLNFMTSCFNHKSTIEFSEAWLCVFSFMLWLDWYWFTSKY